MRFLLLILLLAANTLYAGEEWTGVSRVVAIGDLHGDYDHYMEILKQNGLVNWRGKWAGGETHLVQLGDVPDRGPDSLRIMRHLMDLAGDAEDDGGYVHTLIGNHEAMNIEGDLRYVHPGEYQALLTRDSRRMHAAYMSRVMEDIEENNPELLQDPELDAKLEQQFPLGYVEHRQKWMPGQELAKWVAGNNAVVKINRTLFVHGGINPHGELLPLAEINDRIQDVLSSQEQMGTENYANDANGPLWYRGLAMNDAETELEPLQAMLAHYDADRIVIAHTPTRSGNIETRFDGRVIMADTGISSHYGGNIANLEILPDNEDCRLFMVKAGQQEKDRTCLK